MIHHVLVGFALLFFLYFLLVKEYFHRTVAAGLTASLTLLALILMGRGYFREVIEGIDVDTIVLLMSMMTMVTIMAHSHLFTYLAVKLIKKTHGDPFLLMAILSLSTGAVSAFVDNVTTVVLMTPIILDITRKLRVDPRPLLLSIVFESNIGGTATLIGDPPNILIGSATGLGFNDFLFNLGPIVAVDMFATILLLKYMFHGWFEEWKYRLKHTIAVEEIKVHRPLMIKSIIAFSITIVLFLLEDVIGYPPAIPAMIGAGILLATASREVTIYKALEGVEWTTLVFFVFMFVVIRGIEIMGVMDFIATSMASLGFGKELMIIVIIWISAILSAFVDNIPFVMSMIPVIKDLNRFLGITSPVLFWALSLGGCLGGNGTLVGASANVVVASIAEKHGYSIRFNYYLKYGLPVMLLTVGLANMYLLLFY